jgi:hypothetical protein
MSIESLWENCFMIIVFDLLCFMLVVGYRLSVIIDPSYIHIEVRRTFCANFFSEIGVNAHYKRVKGR